MEIMAFIGILILIIGGIGFLIAAFRTSVIWGLACLLISPVSIIYLVLHWPEAKNPFFLQLAGLAVVLFSGFMGADMPLP
ncbi:hypothetical protein [Marinobacterium marinum]|uniref:Uncharacterized protein n=1 Tax=Marinobacterium marinum TaxID=2756129 RepID=A0A7W1WVA2_9GAMM|nr:hypothetical protein [Marinobacterium marinum]MBA4500854.1 hypothetical protein [Marinobacterium marinum]